MDLAKLRGWRSAKQGLDRLSSLGAREILETAGWSRGVGGSSTYLAMFARAGLDFSAVNEAVARMEVYELPAARGCTYVMPSGDFGLALALARATSPPEKLISAERKVGMTESEVEGLMAGVVQALGEETLDPAQIRSKMGDAVRSFGEEGRKVGMSTSLPSALGRLQTTGQIVRVPVAGRLDAERYSYRRWDSGPAAVADSEAPVAIARKFAGWIGPFSMDEFRWFTGFGVGAAKRAVEQADLPEYEAGWFGLAEEENAFASHTGAGESVRFVGSLDSLFLLARSLQTHIDEADTGHPAFSEKVHVKTGGLADLSNNGIVLGGRLIGFWDYDPDGPELLYKHWAGDPGAVRAEADRVGQMVRDQMGDVRTFSLDSPKSRKDRLTFLRN